MLAKPNFVIAEETEPVEEEAVPNAPIELDEVSFYDLVVERNTKTVWTDKGWFINFYNKNCGHCRQFMPTWEELAKQVAGEIYVGQVSCKTPEAAPICKEF